MNVAIIPSEEEKGALKKFKYRDDRCPGLRGGPQRVAGIYREEQRSCEYLEGFASHPSAWQGLRWNGFLSLEQNFYSAELKIN